MSILEHDIMDSLHKGIKPEQEIFNSKEEQRKPLCSNIDAGRCSSLDFNSNSPLVSKEMAFDYLAEILVTIFLELEHESFRQQTGSDLLPGVHERTSG